MSKNPHPSFTSLRVISEKAQKLLQKAKSLQQKKEPEATRVGLPAKEEHEDALLFRVSVKSVVKSTFAILAILCGVGLVYFLKDKIVLLLLSIFLAAVIDPGVEAMRRGGIPRGLSVILQYFIALFLFLFLLVSLIPIVAQQLGDIARIVNGAVNEFIHDPTISLPLVPPEVDAQLSEFARRTLADLSIEKVTDALNAFSQSISSAAQGSLKFIIQLLGSVGRFFFNMVIVLVLAFFIQLEKEHIFSWIRGFLPRSYRQYMDVKAELIHFKLGQWARGQLVLGLSIGLLVFLALLILGMGNYALTLAMLAAFTEFIPVVGPLLAAIPAVLIAFTQEGPIWALVVAGVYYVIQWCENNLLVPLIMKRAVGLSPIAILFAMLVGISFPTVIHPVLGIILSIPITTIIALFLEDWRAMREARERGSN